MENHLILRYTPYKPSHTDTTSCKVLTRVMLLHFIEEYNLLVIK